MHADSGHIEVQDLLVMAVAIHGSRREVIRGEQFPTANGRPILRQSLVWTGSWNDVTEDALHRDGNNPTVDGLYKTLIGMCRPASDRDLIAGFGNLGSETEPPAHPTYVVFGVTDLGRDYAELLFRDCPEYRSFKDDPPRSPSLRSGRG